MRWHSRDQLARVAGRTIKATDRTPPENAAGVVRAALSNVGIQEGVLGVVTRVFKRDTTKWQRPGRAGAEKRKFKTSCQHMRSR